MTNGLIRNVASTISRKLDPLRHFFAPQPHRKIYFDSLATTMLDPRVMDAMLPYYTSLFGNPHSRTHSFGWEAEKGVEEARKQIANLINADPKEIIFTSGATESTNLALKGVANFKLREGKPVHIVTVQTEHKCVLDTCRQLEEQGVEVTYLPVNGDGLIDLGELERSIRENTSIVSIMAVNNEIGVLQPIKEIGQICKKYNVLFHTDAAQAVGKIPIDVKDMNIAMLSLSGHKIYGPKGVGALFVRRQPRVRLTPLINGGGQERGLRSGTLAPPLCVGMGKAAEICSKEMKNDHAYVSRLSEKLETMLKKGIKELVVNGTGKRYPGCVNISFPYVEGEGLLMHLKDVALSSGSACTSSSLEPSYVLRALGTNEDLAHSSIRYGIGRFSRDEEIEEVSKKTIDAVNKLLCMSPLYEMVKEGVDLSTIHWSA